MIFGKLKRILSFVLPCLFLFFLHGTVANQAHNADEIGPVEDVGWPSEGFIKFKKQGKYGFLSVDGHIQVEPKYDYVIDFIQGQSVVTLDGHSGIIAPDNHFLVKPVYDSIAFLSENFRFASRNKLCGYLQKDGRPLTSFIYNKCGNFKNGFAIVRFVKNKSESCNYIDTKGKLLLKNNAVECYDFNEGLAPVYTGTVYSKYNKKLKCGYVDEKGNFAIPIQHSRCYAFYEGKAVAGQRDLYGYLDKKNHWVLKPQYEWAGNFTEDVAWVRIKKTAGYGLISEKGDFIIQPKVDRIIPAELGGDRIFNYSVAPVFYKTGDKLRCGYINSQGAMLKMFTAANYCEPFWLGHEPFTFVSLSKGFYLINSNMDIVYKDKSNDRKGMIGFNFMTEGRFAVKSNGLWGYINEKGKVVIKEQYQYVKSFNDGYAFVGIGEKGMIIDRFGKVMFSFEYTGSKT